MHVLGIDAGGSKTVALMADSNGRIVGEGRAAGANLQPTALQVEKVLHEVIERAMSDRQTPPDAVCLGMAGVDRANDGPVIADIMRRLGFRQNTLIVNDALIALVAGAGPGPGVVVISGTGSIAFGVSHHGLPRVRVGGARLSAMKARVTGSGAAPSKRWSAPRWPRSGHDADGKSSVFFAVEARPAGAEIYHQPHGRRTIASPGPKSTARAPKAISLPVKS